MEFRNEGRLGTYQPLLLVTLPEGKTAEACNKYTRALPQPIDIGVYPPEFRMPENVIFLNAYNLKPGEEDLVAELILDKEDVCILRLFCINSFWSCILRESEYKRIYGDYV